jgi:hypothetical protein
VLDSLHTKLKALNSIPRIVRKTVITNKFQLPENIKCMDDQNKKDE